MGMYTHAKRLHTHGRISILLTMSEFSGSMSENTEITGYALVDQMNVVWFRLNNAANRCMVVRRCRHRTYVETAAVSRGPSHVATN